MRREETPGAAAAPRPRAADGSSWEPLRTPLFRALWLATLASNLGTWIHEVGAAWLMTSLSPSPLMVSLVQAATSLPMFVLALPAGALADVADRRRILLVTQTWMALAALVLGGLVLSGGVTPGWLLAFTAAMAIGSATNAPAWQASIPEVVGPRRLAAAVALNSMGFNVARAVGPAVGGLLLAAIGPAANFLLNAASFLGVLAVLVRWRPASREEVLPAERFFGALRTGARYVRHAPALHAVLVRGGLFVLFGSALWALLPVVARFELQRGPGGYGALLGSFGTGAVVGALQIHRLRRRFGFDRLAIAATLAFAAALVAVGLGGRFWLALPALFAAGGGWLTVLSGFNTAAQTAVPGWVRARALSTYLLVFYAAMAAGSAGWGALANAFGTRPVFAAAAVGLVLGLLAVRRYPLQLGDAELLAPSRHWPAPLLALEPRHDEGPVLVTVEYRIDPSRAVEFRAAMRQVRRSRRRGGAVRWGLWVDASDPTRWVESFVDESWIEHLRHHERVTAEDREIELAARAFHLDAEPPRVRHLLASRGTPSSHPLPPPEPEGMRP